MLGRIDPSKKEVSVIGGGIAGLLAAHVLDQRGYQVSLYEASSRLGGLIQTHRTENGIVEAAAHSLLATDSILRFCADLGVELVSVRPESKARFILRGGKLKRFPLGPLEAGAAFAKAYFALGGDDESSSEFTLEQWAKRHLGQAALDFLLNPFVRGIYGVRPSELSLPAAFPRLIVPRGHSLLSSLISRKRNPTPSGKKARPRMMAPRNGMGALPEAISQKLAARLGQRIRLNSLLFRLPESPNVVIATPAEAAADLLRELDPQLSQALAEIAYTSLATVTLFVPKECVPESVRGVGVLVPETESQRTCLGILFNSSSFENRAKDESKAVSFTVFLGGSSRQDSLLASDPELIQTAFQEAREILGLSGSAPLEATLQRWDSAIPRYDAKVSQAWLAARQGWCSKPGHVIFGNYSGQVSLRGMIESALGSEWAPEFGSV